MPLFSLFPLTFLLVFLLVGLAVEKTVGKRGKKVAIFCSELKLGSFSSSVVAVLGRYIPLLSHLEGIK